MLTLFNSFKIVAILEGISYILLLFVAVPIKYFGDDPQYVKLLGNPHGFLFLAYVILAVLLSIRLKWNTKTILIVLAASVIPFGTFYVDRTYLKKTK